MLYMLAKIERFEDKLYEFVNGRTLWELLKFCLLLITMYAFLCFWTGGFILFLLHAKVPLAQIPPVYVIIGGMIWTPLLFGVYILYSLLKGLCKLIHFLKNTRM